jgi:hypothetical protein
MSREEPLQWPRAGGYMLCGMIKRTPQAIKTRESVQRSRDRMRAQGLKLLHVWAPDGEAAEAVREIAQQFHLTSEQPDGDLNALVKAMRAALDRELRRRRKE